MVSNVNLEHNYLFIHIPKNAGTSIAAALGHTEASHDTAAQYRKKLGAAFATLYKFCIVRNPWDRFLSTYEYVRMPVSYHHNAAQPELAQFGKHDDFDVVSSLSLTECARLLKSGIGTATAALKSRQWAPQSDWVRGPIAVTMVDFIGRFENLDQAVAEISQSIGVQITLPFLNRSNRAAQSYREVMDQEAVDLIATYYAEDISRFGYTF